MKIAVLFDGAGLARLGLEQANHKCTGFELDPSKHYLSQFVGSGNCILQDATTVNLDSFDAIWASPPCQHWSDQNHGTAGLKEFGDRNLLLWSLDLIKQYPDKVIWVENVISKAAGEWGKKYNAVQFLENPIQKRRRMIGGNYKEPFVYCDFKYNYPKLDICPAVLASEYKQGSKAREWNKERRKATRWFYYKYGRTMNLEDMAYVQGFCIPEEWYKLPTNLLNDKGKKYTKSQWNINLSQSIGNGVPVYMSKGFGMEYND